ncbi:MAG: DUF4333 domain-containing protein [Vicinamibacterales bacterium]
MKTLMFAGQMVLVCALAACTRTLNMDAAKTAIRTGLAEQTGIAISAVTCPETRDIKAGDSFQCTATAETGGDLAVTVTQKDDAGNITWTLASSANLIDLAALETEIKTGLKAQLAVDAQVSCGGGKYRVAVPTKTFECTAKSGDSQAPIIVTMKDDKGNISWESGPAK